MCGRRQPEGAYVRTHLNFHGDGQRIVVTALKPGTYTSRELVPGGWILTGIRCDDDDSCGDVGTATATFRLQAGETVTCTFDDLWRGYSVYLPVVSRFVPWRGSVITEGSIPVSV